jgi:hypothetical protein
MTARARPGPRLALAGLAIALLAAPALAQEKAQVDAAVERAKAWLLARLEAGAGGPGAPLAATEQSLFAVLALSHTDALARDPALRRRALELLYRYPVGAIHATAVVILALDRLGGPVHAERIADAARAILEGQSALEGGWTYVGPEPDPPPPVRPLPQAAAATATAAPAAIVVERAGEGWERDRRDNTSSEFGVLGLHGAAAAGVAVGPEPWRRAVDYFAAGQAPDGGWGSFWKEPASYGGMTCAGVVGLSLALHHAGAADPASDPRVRRGLAWLEERFAVDRNPYPKSRKNKHSNHFYYLCALERVGDLLGLERLGDHDWYAEGARYLLSMQREDGAFVAEENREGAVERQIEDTCFALLFLRRATARLAAPPAPAAPR